MWAYNLHGISDLRYEEVSIPEVEDGWVLVEVKAAGICGSDIPRIFETGTYHFPLIPGHEFSGIVREVSKEGNENLLGKRVGVFPLIPCKVCDSCKQQNYETCSNYSYLGSRIDGGFAEYVKVPEWNVIELPDAILFEEAALLEPISVALHALRNINFSNIDSALIYGIGPIGLVVAQWLRTFEVKNIFLVANKEEQIVIAKELDLYNSVNSKTTNVENWVLENTDNQGMTLVIEGVGTDDAMEKCITYTASNGVLITLANPKGDMQLKKNTYWQILRKQITIYGTWNSRFGVNENNDWTRSIKALLDKQIRVEPLITHKLSFENLPIGLEMMKNKNEFYSKVMIIR